MRKLFFGGNWKSNNTLAKTQGLVGSLLDKLEFDPAQVGNYPNIKMWSFLQFSYIWSQ